jgi:hypothetical protein
MEHTVQLFHLLALFFETETWFEYVPSGQNWSDGLSRNGPTDQWIVARGIPCSAARAPLAPWQRALAEFWQGWSDGNPLERLGNTLEAERHAVRVRPLLPKDVPLRATLVRATLAPLLKSVQVSIQHANHIRSLYWPAWHGRWALQT